MRTTRYTIVLFVILALMACFTQQARMADGGGNAAVLQDDASELALLMRAMAAHADSVKASLARDGKLPAKPKHFDSLFTATPTDGMHIDPITYPTFGNDYLKKLDALYKAPRKERPQAYNALVQGCANCHGTHCPGPLMRIKKMYVPL